MVVVVRVVVVLTVVVAVLIFVAVRSCWTLVVLLVKIPPD